MKTERGFSMTEVLVSLLLAMSISQVLLQQQWHASRLLTEVSQRSQALLQSETDAERRCFFQQGLGLIECLVGLFLASCIMSSLMVQYVSIKRHYLWSQTQLHHTMRLEWVTHLMQASIRRAGFAPCLSIDQLMRLDDNVTAISYRSNALHLHRMDDAFVSDVTIISPKLLQVPSVPDALVGHAILIADCFHAEVHTVSATSSHALHLEESLRFHYHDPIFVGAWMDESFIVTPGSGLSYHHRHTETLMPDVTRMNITLEHHNQKTLVQVSLSLKNKDTRQIVAMVR